MDTNTISDVIYDHYKYFYYRLMNQFIFRWESDFFGISKTGYCYEVEIKVSRSDYNADFKKIEKHLKLKNHENEIITIPGPKNYHYDRNSRERIHIGNYISVVKNFLPNKFYYACPDGLINIKDIPDYAGLLYITHKHKEVYNVNEIKSAPFLHKNKYLSEKWFVSKLLDKFYWKSINLENKIKIIRKVQKSNEMMFLYPDEFEKEVKQLSLFE